MRERRLPPRRSLWYGRPRSDGARSGDDLVDAIGVGCCVPPLRSRLSAGTLTSPRRSLWHGWPGSRNVRSGADFVDTSGAWLLCSSASFPPPGGNADFPRRSLWSEWSGCRNVRAGVDQVEVAGEGCCVPSLRFRHRAETLESPRRSLKDPARASLVRRMRTKKNRPEAALARMDGHPHTPVTSATTRRSASTMPRC